MTVNKQTVWLVTMLTLMVVLSAYYIVTGPVEPVSTVDKQNAEVDLKEVDPSVAKDAASALSQSSNYFVSTQLQRNTLRSKMQEEYMKTLANPDASSVAIREAQQKLDDLTKVDKKEQVLEELMRNEGFKDAVVLTNDSHVDVFVQSDTLSSEQAVKIISLVKKQLNVSSTNVSVSNRN